MFSVSPTVKKAVPWLSIYWQLAATSGRHENVTDVGS
jgi:hypothetical protein